MFNNSDIDIIQDNVPNISKEVIEKSFIKNSYDIMKTICDLLEIKEEKKELTEWEKRREIADLRSIEINKILNSKKINENIPVNSVYEDNIIKHDIETISEISYSNITVNENM